MGEHLHRWLKRSTLAIWLLVLAAALIGMCHTMESIRDRHLRADAEQVALAWAEYASRTVPDLDLIFDGEMPSTPAQDSLGNLRKAPNVFAFAFFDAAGRRLLESNSLNTRPEDGDINDRDIARRVVESGATQVILEHGDGRARPERLSQAYVPVRQGGRVVGVVDVRVDQSLRAATIGDAFRAVGMAVAVALLAVFGVGIWMWLRRSRLEREAEERLRYLARHDVLTGAINRSSFEAALEQAIWRRGQGGPGFAVLCIDLDHFKEVNDTLGHHAGDEMLRQVRTRLAALVRSSDVVARLGGDEFALLQSGVDSSDAVATLAQRVVETLSAPYDLAGQPCLGAASVGAAIHGIDGDKAETLMQRADLALYRSKANGRAGYSFYDPGLDHALQSRRTLTRELREALATDALAVHFQPVYGGDGHRLAGYEALSRWPHPTRGFVPPSEFVPLAEETGLIDELGRWVLRTACAEAASWPRALSVAVNLSPLQFRREGAIIEEVQRALADSGLAPERLELEITESLLMSNTEPVLRTLQALHAMGVRIAMDDFGTGYSSLSYLWKFPFDKVKIDRAFTQNLGDDSKVDLIVGSIVTLAHSLKIRVNAEGVETTTQRALLTGHGCDELQGYLLGRPMPADRLPHKQATSGEVAAALTPACS